MTNATGKVALTASFPVDVLTKSDPAIMQTRLALYTFVREPSSPGKKNNGMLKVWHLHHGQTSQPLLYSFSGKQEQRQCSEEIEQK